MAIVATGLVVLSPPVPSAAATFEPTDTIELRHALSAAGANGQEDVIDLGGRTFGIPPRSPLETAPDDGHLLTIRNGELDGDGASRVLQVTHGSHVVLEDVHVTRGRMVDGGGAGILNEGVLELHRSQVTESEATGDGGGLLNYGTANIYDSTVEGNRSDGNGGGIANIKRNEDPRAGRLRIERSVLRDNHADADVSREGDGGGVHTLEGFLWLDASTVAENSGFAGGGLNVYRGSAEIYNSTITRNDGSLEVTGYGGGGIRAIVSVLRVYYSTITANTAGDHGGVEHLGGGDDDGIAIGSVIADNNSRNTGWDCDWFFDDGTAYNVAGPGCPTGPGSVYLPPTADLGPLQDNGGPTPTREPAPGSVAVDLIPATAPHCPETDQRGVRRPRYEACDAGAVELIERLVTVTYEGSGEGTITTDPDLFTCEATCDVELRQEDEQVTLTAHADRGSVFEGWGGACSGTSPCTVSLDEDREVTARFRRTGTRLTVEKEGPGFGSVVSDPPGMTCDATTCEDWFERGQLVTITAVPDEGSTFDGWGGICASAREEPCTLTMDADTTAIARFTAPTLSVVTLGQGSGTITDGGGLVCPPTCTLGYPHNGEVTLTATPDHGSSFREWEGDSCDVVEGNRCTLVLDRNRMVVASFDLVPQLLSVTLAGTGSGRVVDPVGPIRCPDSICTWGYLYGSDVALQAEPAAGSRFAGWSGPCTGTGACELTVVEPTEVVAEFERILHTFSIAVAGDGSGTVRDGRSLACTSACEVDYGALDTVTFTADPAPGSQFTGWSGACTGTGPCTVTVEGAAELTATFAVQPGLDVELGGTGSGRVTSDPAGLDCPSTCSHPFDRGTAVTVTATPEHPSTVAAIGGACTADPGAPGEAVSCSVTTTEDTSVTATFDNLSTGTVPTTADDGDDGICSDDHCTLREAVTAAAELDGDDVIPLAGRHYTLAMGQLVVDDDAGVTFQGPGTIDGGDGTRVLAVRAGSTVTLEEVVVRDGFANGADGGGISNAGDLRVVSSTVTANRATGHGGGILNAEGGTLHIEASTISDNTAGNGGGIRSLPKAGSVSITESTISGNTASAAGGGILNTGSAITMVASTVSGNSAGTLGGGLWHGTGTTVTITSSTITANSAAEGAGGVGSPVVPLIVKASVVWGNVGGDCEHASTSGGFNVVGDGCTADGEADTTEHPALGALADNGGPTWTHAITSQSSAFDRHRSDDGGCTGTDQRGVARPQGDHCDAGAFEAEPVSGPDRTLRVTIAVDGGGSVSGPGIECDAQCEVDYEDGTEVVLAADAADGHRFVGWSGACGGAGECVVTMDRDREVRAEFEVVPPPDPTVTVTLTGGGEGRVVGSGLDCPDACQQRFATGSTVTLEAQPAAGSRFAGWGGDCVVDGEGRCVIDVQGDAEVVATFESTETATWRLSVDVDPGDIGWVIAEEIGIDCPLRCEAVLEEGTQVELRADADSNYAFTGWTGACSGTARCHLVMDGDKEVGATFERLEEGEHELVVWIEGEGSVTGAGIECPDACVARHERGAEVQLTATPADGWQFVEWVDDCVATTPTCTLTVEGNSWVTPVFTPIDPPPDRSVLVSVQGSGSVSGGGIDCPETCEVVVPDGTEVSLSAAPADGWRFVGWTGACSGTGACVLTVTEDRSVGAVFEEDPPPPVEHTLRATTTGAGTDARRARGEVTTDPAGISCERGGWIVRDDQGDCQEDYVEGTTVTVTATPASSDTTARIDGACTAPEGAPGEPVTCTVAIQGDGEVTATFGRGDRPTAPDACSIVVDVFGWELRIWNPLCLLRRWLSGSSADVERSHAGRAASTTAAVEGAGAGRVADATAAVEGVDEADPRGPRPWVARQAEHGVDGAPSVAAGPADRRDEREPSIEGRGSWVRSWADTVRARWTTRPPERHGRSWVATVVLAWSRGWTSPGAPRPAASAPGR